MTLYGHSVHSFLKQIISEFLPDAMNPRGTAANNTDEVPLLRDESSIQGIRITVSW